MRRFAAVVGWMFVVLAGVLAVLGVSSLPSGGLMFALPYIFFIPAVFFGAAGGLLLWLSRRPIR